MIGDEPLSPDEAALAYDIRGQAMLRIGLGTGNSFLLRLPNGLEREIPMTERGIEMLAHILGAQARATRKTVGTRAAPTAQILEMWARKDPGGEFPLTMPKPQFRGSDPNVILSRSDGVVVRKFRENGSVDLDDLEVD